jgi:predicted transcriptional regulator
MKKFLDSNSRRKVDILIMLNKEHGVTFDDLSQRLNASRPTIMRDLEEMAGNRSHCYNKKNNRIFSSKSEIFIASNFIALFK